MSYPSRTLYKLAITGNIACGKSLVGDFLKTQGYPVLDTDAVVHTLLKENAEVKQLLWQRYGDTVFEPGSQNASEVTAPPSSACTGWVNRQQLGKIVFQDAVEKQWLEGLLHPRVRQEVARFFEQTATEGHPLAAVLIPLLYESGQQAQYDGAWLITATPEQQLERLMKDRGMAKADALRRMKSQISQEDKLALADVRIDNSGSPAHTHQQVLAALQRILTRS